MTAHRSILVRNGARLFLPLAMLCSITAGAAPVLAAGESGVVEGQVFDGDARPLPGIVVQLVSQRDGFLAQLRGDEPEARVIGTAVTDAAGLFRIRPGELPRRGRLFVWCGASGPWDALRYERPAPRDVTRSVRGGKATVVFRVQDAHAWAELAREIERAGGVKTPRGRILRRHGLPPERVAELGGREQWIYPGASYLFAGEELVEARDGPAVERAKAETEDR